jgi:hypothetical protein
MKYRDEGGKEYILIDEALADAVFYFSIVFAVALSLLAFISVRLP